MHRKLAVVASFVMAAFLGGCPAKPKNGECKISEDCSAQEGFGKTCVEGRCQECGLDTDCKTGFVCRSLKCVPRPECELNTDCPAGKGCSGGKCVSITPAALPQECMTDYACGPGKACMSGKCVTATSSTCPPNGGKLMSIYFAFDRATLTPESQDALSKNADCIKAMGFKRVTVDGNCDDRGTVEYNLHLGQRRAEAARRYLVHLGINPTSIQSISFGKEHPVCDGQSEGCRQANRRDDIRAQ
jgi:peptidoglycan-associated lipoprotein